MKEGQEFTAVFLKRDKWYVGYVEELPGVNTQGATLEEARENLREALQLILQANRELAAALPGNVPVIREPLHIRAHETPR
jgi:predicted RNase H-like HicB family nuclease